LNYSFSPPFATTFFMVFALLINDNYYFPSTTSEASTGWKPVASNLVVRRRLDAIYRKIVVAVSLLFAL
ncbi:MAG: hypothetical protein OER74_18090, partial [Desulfobacteraceae bacterium]|nr:hypothetical protein [Desulfobacteraceae bacterium]